MELHDSAQRPLLRAILFVSNDHNLPNPDAVLFRSSFPFGVGLNFRQVLFVSFFAASTVLATSGRAHNAFVVRVQSTQTGEVENAYKCYGQSGNFRSQRLEIFGIGGQCSERSGIVNGLDLAKKHSKLFIVWLCVLQDLNRFTALTPTSHKPPKTGDRAGIKCQWLPLLIKNLSIFLFSRINVYNCLTSGKAR